MGRRQAWLLLGAGAALALIAGSLFGLEWFRVSFGLGGAALEVGLRDARICSLAQECVNAPIGELGFYSTLAWLAFWSGLALMMIVTLQCGAKVFGGGASEVLAKLGYPIGSITFLAAFGAGFLFGPETRSIGGMTLVTVERTWSPLLLLVGALLALLSLRYATSEPLEDDEAPYKPVIVPKHALGPEAPEATVDQGRSKSPSSPPAVARTRSPSKAPVVARTHSPSSPPADARTKSPTAQPLDVPARARTSSSGPVDVAARLTATAPTDVAIRAAPPAPPAIPDDQIPVAPESGLTIRKKGASIAPPINDQIPVAPESGLTIRKKGASLAPFATDAATKVSGNEPDALRGKLRYAAAAASLSSATLSATLAEGGQKIVRWKDVVGLVARRLPPVAPYDGATFVDIVSTPGSTLRILPWTELTGCAVPTAEDERLRGFLKLVAEHCPDVQIDVTTRAFVDGIRRAAQLPDTTLLATHDQRLA